MNDDARLTQLEAQLHGIQTEVEFLRRALRATCELHARESAAARIDQMTGCMTRAKFEEIAGTVRGTFAVIMIDLDHFKQINDTDGHQRGDFVLQRIGQLLRDNCREDDIVARYGGEEFIVLLQRADLRRAEDWARRFRKTLEQENLAHPSQQRVTASAGCAATMGGKEMSQVIGAADAARVPSEGRRSRSRRRIGG